MTKLSMGVKATILGASLVATPAVFTAEKELLEILKAKGSISISQNDALLAKADKPSNE